VCRPYERNRRAKRSDLEPFALPARDAIQLRLPGCERVIAFSMRPGRAGENVEGIRALVINKDHTPRWNPAHIKDVTPEMVQPFFASPWAPVVEFWRKIPTADPVCPYRS
jgi:hypothetical protein